MTEATHIPDKAPQYVKRATVQHVIPSGIQGDVITIYLPVPMQERDVKSLTHWVRLLSKLVNEELSR